MEQPKNCYPIIDGPLDMLQRGSSIKISTNSSFAASGWAGWALAHPEFGSSVNPITTRGADYAHHITASPPGFENPAASQKIANKYIKIKY